MNLKRESSVISSILLAIATAGLGCCDKHAIAAPSTAPTTAPTFETSQRDPAAYIRRFPAYAKPMVVVTEETIGKDIRLTHKQSLATIDMVKIPAGSIEMPILGRDGKLDLAKTQTVRIKSFYISKTEVPWELYDAWWYLSDLSGDERWELYHTEALMRRDARSHPTETYGRWDWGFGHDGYPAISIHPYAVRWFCTWLSVVTGKNHRLSTEAEWEYACRAGGPPTLEKATLDKVAWYFENSKNELGEPTTHPVGRRSPNAFGLQDMLGNAGEWLVGIDGQWVLKGGSFRSRIAAVNARARIPFDDGIMQMREPQEPKGLGWLSDAPFAGFRVVRDE